MRNKITILILIASLRFLIAQSNLVVNHSFELSSACPTITGQYHLCNNWFNCNGNIGPGLWGTPDYYNTCGTFHPTYNPVPPNTAIGVINPQAGNALMGLVVYNTPYPDYREYLSNQLSCPMQPGETYTVSFWLNNGTQPKYKFNSSHFGVYFSNTMPVQVGYGLINVTPQFEITTIITNTVWTQYTFTINPSSTFNYITLGCFRSDNIIQVNNATPSATNPYSNWYIDNIQVLKNNFIPASINVVNASCNQSNGTATVQPVSANCTFTWLPGGQNTNVVSGLASGVYSVIINDGCSTDTKTLSILNSNSPTLTLTNATLCSAGTATLNATVVGGTAPYSYFWSNGSTSPVNSVSINNTSVYSCTVTDNFGCKSISNSTVFLNGIQSAFNHSLNVCKGKVFTTNSSVSATTYTWNFGDGFTTNLVSPIHTYTLPGTYTITLYSANGANCLDSSKKVVTISSISKADFNFNVSTCDSTVYFNNLSIGATNFNWNFGDGFTSTSNGTVNHTYSNPGTYTVILISNPSGVCPDTAIKIVNLNYNSVANFNFALNECNRIVSLTNLSLNTNNYFWDLGDSFTSTLTSLSHTYSGFSNQTFTIYLIVNKGTACADTISKQIQLKEKAEANFDFKNSTCSGMVTFSNTSINASDYFWDFGNNTQSNLKDPIINFNKQGYYNVKLISYANINCPDTIIKTIHVTFNPVLADFDYNYIINSYDVELINKSSNANFYLWDFNDGNSTTVENPKHTFENPQKIRICLSAKNTLGCGDTICKDILIKPDWTFYLPNTFTPNDDGVNDTFLPKATNIQSFEITIFNRWGENIFKSNDFNNVWDGTYKGEQVKDDVYVWQVKVVDLFSKSHYLIGHVMVLK